ncbi:MAG: hypothetical protein H7177_06420 [Rhizobacter sp.]|nr:hypothetical protein [Bacteriovorax sp.]
MLKFYIFVLFCSFAPLCSAANNPNNFVFNRGSWIVVAPPYVNKDYYDLEIGFITEKIFERWNYNYNAYVTGTVFEDWKDKTDRYRAGALGFKAGIIVPTNPWVPLLFSISAGYAKAVLNRNPLIGNESQNAAKNTMLLAEAGLMYKVDKYFLRFAYQQSNVKYFTRHTLLALGVSY